MASSELSVMLTAKGNLESELKQARERVKSLGLEIKKANLAGEGVGEDLAGEYRKASMAAQRLGQQVNETNRQIKKASTESTSALTRLSGSLTKHQDAIRNTGLVAAAAMLYLAKKSLTAYSSVQDASDALTATFHKNGKSLIAWAKANGDAYNLTQAEALTSLQRFAGMAQAAGLKGNALTKFAEDMTKRAADLASYFGGSTQDALAAMISGLSGQIEPLRNYNIFMNEAGLITEAHRMKLKVLGKTLTENQKILARRSLIMRLSNQVEGDVARTANSTANTIKDATQQWNDFQASLGETVAVIAGPLLKAGSFLLKFVSGLPGPIKMAVIGIGALGIAVMILMPKLLALRASLAQIALANAAVGTSATVAGAKMTLMGSLGSGLSSMFSGLVSPLGLVTIGIGAAAFAWQAYSDAQADAQADADKLRDTLDKVTGAATKSTKAVIASKLASTMSAAEIAALGQVGITTASMAHAVATGGKAMSGLQNRMTVARQYGIATQNSALVSGLSTANKEMGYQSTALSTAQSDKNDSDAKKAALKKAGTGEVLTVADMKAVIDNVKIDPGALEAAKLTTSDPTAQKTLALIETNSRNTADAVGRLGGMPLGYQTNLYPVPSFVDPKTVKKARGGIVMGPGTGTSDSIPALLSNGEYVLRAAAVRRLGLSALNQMNHADRMTDPALLARLSTPLAIPIGAGGAPLIGEIHVHNPASGIDVEAAVVRGISRVRRLEQERGGHGR